MFFFLEKIKQLDFGTRKLPLIQKINGKKIYPKAIHSSFMCTIAKQNFEHKDEKFEEFLLMTNLIQKTP